ncbi:hypothetical protein PIB30_071669 [Stylosanthes scabra]|uniref:Uncharacterized protein n=1 Tax=Stylosanthes scabra TaxID=79078 RepID=A0ABU6SQB6_9FABA|nr:hypothetical protein [Stylosanthes scabra]
MGLILYGTQPDCGHITSWIMCKSNWVDRVMRQLGADQPIPMNPVNVDAFLTITGRGEDILWPTHRTTRAWYESWMRHTTDSVVIQIIPEPNFRGNREYLE